MAIQFQLRRDTAANWTSNDPTLAEGEIGLETDTLKMKMGDGSTAWTSLAYVANVKGDTGSTGANGNQIIGINDQTGTTYELVVGDAGKLVTCYNSSPITVTIPKDTFAIKDVITLDQKGTGQITVAPAADVTVNGYGGLKSMGQYAGLSIVCIDTNIFRLYGGKA